MASSSGDFNSLSPPPTSPTGSWFLSHSSPLPLHRPHNSRLQPLTLRQTILNHHKDCFKLIGLNTIIGLLCFFAAVPYMVWATYAGNYATLVKGVHVSPVSRDLEGVDTLMIGAFGIIIAPWVMWYMFDSPVMGKILKFCIVIMVIGVVSVVPLRYVINEPDLYVGVLYAIGACVCIGAPWYARAELGQPKLPLFYGVPCIIIAAIHFIVDYTIVPAYEETQQREFRVLVRVLLAPIFFGCIISVVRPLSRNITGVKGEHFQIFIVLIHCFNRAAFGRLFTYELNSYWYVTVASVSTSGGVFIFRIIYWNRNKILSMFGAKVAPFPPPKFVDAFLVYNDPGDEYYALTLNVDRFLETASILMLGFLKILSVVAYTHPLNTQALRMTVGLIAIQILIEAIFQIITCFTEIYWEIPITNFLATWQPFLKVSALIFVFGAFMISWKALYMMSGKYLVSL